MSEEVKLYVACPDPAYTIITVVNSSQIQTTFPENNWHILTIPENQKEYYLARRYSVFDNYWLAFGECEKRKQNVAT
jgi:hypothetical protein